MSAEVETNLTPEIGHILSIDVVGYSTLLVDEQIALMTQLNRIVRESSCFRAAEGSGKLFRLPTGDGMVLVFFESLEAPLRCAMEISEELRALPHIRVRMGAHSGPVNEIQDVNGKKNVAGSGINLVQRVLDCGDAGHILLSKRLADDLAQYRHWQPYLHQLGECVVKHGLQLSLVNFWNDSVGNSEVPQKIKCSQLQPANRKLSAKRRLTWSALAVIALLIALGFSLILVRRNSTNSAREKSIAVLPFENLSDDPHNIFFADGMQDEILTDLAKVADLKVISRTSVMKYRNTPVLNLRQIGDALRVRYVLEGSVQRAGQNVRVSAQLIDATNDSHLWADSYDRQLSDVFAIQSDIAENITAQLQARLTPEEKAAMEVRPTTDSRAHDLYLQAKETIDRVIYDSNQIENLFQAEKLLEEATMRDPKFFLAFCKLAYVHDQIYFNSLDHTPERLAKAQAALDQAQQLDPDAGEYHLAAAAHYYFGYLEYDRARQELVIARQKLPNDPYPILLLGYIDRRQGRWDQSTAELERALELDPRNLLFLKQLALSYTNLRRYSEVVGTLDRAIAIAPADPNFLTQRAIVQLDWKADTKPLHKLIQQMRDDETELSAVASEWLTLALCERDTASANQALAAMSEKGFEEEGIPLPKAWARGLIARERGDNASAQLAFREARGEVEALVRQQSDFAAGISALGMIDAALGKKEQAIDEGYRATVLLPVSKDAVRGPVLLQNLAIIYCWLGDRDRALIQLHQLVTMPCYLSYGLLQLHPYWDPLRSDKRFVQLLSLSQAPTTK